MSSRLYTSLLIQSEFIFLSLSTLEALYAVRPVGSRWMCFTSFGLSGTGLCLCGSGALC